MATQRSADVAPHLTGPAYGVAVLFVVLPIIDTLAQVWPVALGSPSWRYGAVGLGANYLISFVFGMWLLCFLAARQLHRGTLRSLATASGVVAVLLLIAAAGFALDAIQLRPGVPRDNPRNLWTFEVGAAKAAFKYVVSGVVLGWLALSSRRAWRAIPQQAPEESPKLVRSSKAGG